MADQIKFEGNKVTITLENPLNGETSYHVKVDATAIVDKAGNAFVGISDESTLSFTTSDATAPQLVSSTPAAGATDVPVNSTIVLTFSEEIQAGTGSITVSNGSDDVRTVSVV